MTLFAIGDLHLPGGEEKPMDILATTGRITLRISRRIGARVLRTGMSC